MCCFCPALASVGGDSNATGRERFSRLRCWPPGGHVPAVGRQHSPPRDVARRWTPTCFRREHLSVRLCQVRPFPLRTAQPQSVASWLRPHPAPRPATLAAGVGTHAGPRLLFLPPPGASDVFPALGPRARIQAVAWRGRRAWHVPLVVSLGLPLQVGVTQRCAGRDVPPEQQGRAVLPLRTDSVWAANIFAPVGQAAPAARSHFPCVAEVAGWSVTLRAPSLWSAGATVFCRRQLGVLPLETSPREGPALGW